MNKTSYSKIPRTIVVGGQSVRTCFVDKLKDDCLGTCHLPSGTIEISETCIDGSSHSESSKRNTFFHELTHAILDTMGEYKLSRNEKFVCAFSSFLCEAMKDAIFIYEENGEENIPQIPH